MAAKGKTQHISQASVPDDCDQRGKKDINSSVLCSNSTGSHCLQGFFFLIVVVVVNLQFQDQKGC